MNDEALTKGVSVYRISRGADFWRRRWQAEWPMCATAPRAWTRRGVVMKALRWRRYGADVDSIECVTKDDVKLIVAQAFEAETRRATQAQRAYPRHTKAT